MNRRFNIILIASLLFLASCNEKGIEPDTPDGSIPIEFGQVTTKAITSIDDVDEFGVSVAVSNALPNAGFGSLMENEMVYRDNNGDWTYDNTRYWLKDYYYFFLASYPCTNENGESWGFDFFSDSSLSMYYYTLDVKTPQSADSDILAATNFISTYDNWTSSPVKLKFSHLLTKVNFKIQQDFDKDSDFDYYITKVTLSGIKNSALYGVAPTTYPPYSFSEWNFDNATTFSIEQSFANPVRLRDLTKPDPTVVISVWNNGLLLIPQDIEARTVKIRIDYLYDITPGEGDNGVPHYIEGYLPASEIDYNPNANPTTNNGWGSGKVITYLLKISETKSSDIK